MNNELIKRVEKEEKDRIIITETYADETYTEFALSKDKTQLLKCKTNSSKVEIPSSVTTIGSSACT